MKSELHIGIIVDDYLLPAWVVKTLEKIQALGYVHFSLVVKANSHSAERSPYLYSLYERKNAELDGIPDAFEQQDATSLLLNNISTVASDIAERQGVNTHVDVLINFSEHKASELYADIPQYGVWRPFFSETRDTQVPGVWEVLERRPLTISGVEVTDKDESKRVVYQSAALTNPYSITESRNSYYWKSVSFLPRVLEMLHSDVQGFMNISVPPYKSVKPKKKYLQTPSNLSVLNAFINPIPGRISTKLKNFSLKRDWILMYDVNSYEGKPFLPENFKKLIASPGFFWADPIAVAHEGRQFIFLEEYVYEEKKGRISVIEIDKEGNPSAPVTILDLPYHLSYPFIFEKDGKHYMIPETGANKTVDLYECIEFPYKWEFKKNLLTDIRAVDNTVLFYDNKWWLFANVKEQEGASSLDELFLFYSDDIINSELKAHPQNPIVSDVRSARPAGPVFTRDGQLYRPSQICAPYYGWGVSVNKVLTLTGEEYSEQRVSSITPDMQQKIAGVHTLSYAGSLCVVDALVDMKK
jgi:hypothetical protein